MIIPRTSKSIVYNFMQGFSSKPIGIKLLYIGSSIVVGAGTVALMYGGGLMATQTLFSLGAMLYVRIKSEICKIMFNKLKEKAKVVLEAYNTFSEYANELQFIDPEEPSIQASIRHEYHKEEDRIHEEIRVNKAIIRNQNN